MGKEEDFENALLYILIPHDGTSNVMCFVVKPQTLSRGDCKKMYVFKATGYILLNLYNISCESECVCVLIHARVHIQTNLYYNILLQRKKKNSKEMNIYRMYC